MAIVIKPKRSETASSAPGTSDIVDGEIAVNIADKKIYIRHSDDTIVTLSDGANLTSGSTSTIDATTDIILDADGGDIFFKDAGTTFGSATNTSGNLIVKSGTTTALTFSGANVTAAGTIGSGAITSTGVVTGTGFTIGSAAILEAELEILDGATVTTTELNLLDGGTSVGASITVADADGIIVNDGGVMKTIPATDIKTYAGGGATAADDIGTGDAAVSITTSVGNITIDAAANNTDIIFKGTDATADITMLTLDGSEAGKAIFNSAITGGGLLTTGGNIVIPDAGNIGSASDTDAIAISSAGVVTFSGVVTPTVSFHLPSLTAVPSSPSAGNIYFDTDDKKTWVYNGTSWNSLLSQGVSYRYTRYYVVSASAGHHPRISRVYLIQQDGTKVQVYNASSADNCTDGGDIPANDANYTDDAGAAGGKIFTGFGFYSTYTGGNRGSNIKLEGSVDNSTWVQIGQTVDAQSNSACGEIDFYV